MGLSVQSFGGNRGESSSYSGIQTIAGRFGYKFRTCSRPPHENPLCDWWSLGAPTKRAFRGAGPFGYRRGLLSPLRDAVLSSTAGRDARLDWTIAAKLFAALFAI